MLQAHTIKGQGRWYVLKIVIAPDSFKGSLSAKEVADCIGNGIRKVVKDAEFVKVPMADGGEGTVQSLVDATGGRIINVKVKGPLLKKVDAFYGILGNGDTAVIEMAAASGLPLISVEERNPMVTTTYGTGELIKHALDMGCRRIIIGIGGSATNDGGAGMAKALGVNFFDSEGNSIGYGGGALGNLAGIDVSGLDERIKECEIITACDVNNPLCGPMGASYVYGPQKGADEEMVKVLDKNLEHYGHVIEEQLGVSIIDYPGAGAAGGLGGGLLAFLNAKLKRGIDIVIDITRLEDKIRDADLVITAEGKIDYQTAFGKTPFGVAQLAKKYGIPVIAFAGSLGSGTDILYENGFNSIFSIIDKPMALEESIRDCDMLLENISERAMRAVLIGSSFRNKL